MLIEYRTAEEDAELLAPAQVKQFVDTMLAHARFNDEYAASVYDSEEIRRLNPVDRQILGLLVGAKRMRKKVVENDISQVLEDIRELSTELNIPVKPGSINEKIVGRELLRALADYYEECADRERKERGLPDDPEVKQLSLAQLEKRLSAAWKRQYHAAEPPIEAMEPSGPRSTSSTESSSIGRDTARDAITYPVRSIQHDDTPSNGDGLDPNLPTSAVWDQYIRDLKVEKTRESPKKL